MFLFISLLRVYTILFGFSYVATVTVYVQEFYWVALERQSMFIFLKNIINILYTIYPEGFTSISIYCICWWYIYFLLDEKETD